MTITDHAPLPPTSTATTAATTTALLRAAADGDQAAWRALVARFEPMVRSVVAAHRLQPADARDAVQGTWLSMVEHHHELRDPEALPGWLRTTARRECLKILRDRRRVEPLDDAAVGRIRDPAVDVERSAVDADTVRRVRGLVRLLPPRAASLVHELFQEAPPDYARIARSIGMPVGSIGPTRARALVKLRRLFEDGVVGSGA